MAHEPSSLSADQQHAMGEEHEHPTWEQYKWVAIILTVITAIEVAVYYTSFRHSPAFPWVLGAMSIAKFAIVVMYYMHLKYDHKLFRALFVGPLMIAASTLIALMFLFSKFARG